ncbi:MAG TPA: DUF4190 domain-containing protein [Candidatus Saccharimonadales bacterium]|nr:DUF4190 domain-containing protein [Candidatus Saccharimonadales bacterium]
MTVQPIQNEQPAMKGRRSGLALASFVLGISGLLLCVVGPMLGIAAVISGYKARTEIRNSQGQLVGMRLAGWGIATGYISMVLIFAIIFGTIYVGPKIMVRQQEAARKECLENLELIQGYKEKWALQYNRPSQAMPREHDLFGPGRYLEQKPVCPSRGTYIINAVQDPPFCNVHGTIRW